MGRQERVKSSHQNLVRLNVWLIFFSSKEDIYDLIKYMSEETDEKLHDGFQKDDEEERLVSFFSSSLMLLIN